MKKLLFLAAFMLALFTSCDNESMDSTNPTNEAQVGLHAKGMYDFTKATKVENVLYQNADDLTDKLNGKTSWIAFFKDEVLGDPPFGTETPGWFYNDNTGCLIYGTWVSWPSGIRIFEPASAATQYIMNDCESAKDVA